MALRWGAFLGSRFERSFLRVFFPVFGTRDTQLLTFISGSNDDG